MTFYYYVIIKDKKSFITASIRKSENPNKKPSEDTPIVEYKKFDNFEDAQQYMHKVIKIRYIRNGKPIKPIRK